MAAVAHHIIFVSAAVQKATAWAAEFHWESGSSGFRWESRPSAAEWVGGIAKWPRWDSGR